MTPTVALTFDDGPSEWTPGLLDVLAATDSHATFFVLGSQIAGHEPTLRRAHDEGHEIGIHGWDHKPVCDLEPGALLAQVEMTDYAIEEATGESPRWWRPPWNRVEGVALILAERGYSYCGVTLDGLDVSRPEDVIVRTVLRGMRDGSIVGLHDGIASNGEQYVLHREATVRATKQILRHCRSVTVTDMLGARA
jgi:peptidoglycan-N-acetylglucosamine deacetylase